MKEMVGGCCVCSDERGWQDNPLVYCDGCNVAVHQACYGIVLVPTGPWFCRKCESQERTARVRCELCPSKDGALKRTDGGGWAHVVCALYIPEVRFGNVTTMEPIILQLVPEDRYSKNCYLCEDSSKDGRATSGACMQCNKSGCKQYFHVTCAQAAGLLCEEAGNYMGNVKYCGYCQYHYQKLKKGNSIKTIPAFKPIPAENATPDSTPEKNSPPREKEKKIKDKERKLCKVNLPTVALSLGMFGEAAAGGSFMDPSSGSGSGKGDPGNGASGGKFTTANFTETVITHGSSVFGSAEKVKKSKKSGGSKASSSASAAHSEVESEDMNVTVSDAGSDTGVKGGGRGGSGMAHSAESALDYVATRPEVCATPAAAAAAVVVSAAGSGPTSSASYSSVYESFLSGNYTTSGACKMEGYTKRQKVQGPEKERKKHKKNGSSRKGKSSKDGNVVNLSSSPSSSPSPLTVPVAGNSLSGKKSKSKRDVLAGSNAGLGTTIRPVGFSGVDHTYFRAFGQPNSGVPLSNGVPSVHQGSDLAEVRTPAGNPDPLGEASTTNPTSTSSSASVGPSGINLSAASKNTNPGLNFQQQFPQSLEQLLERQWEQGSSFLLEQAQHFDIASLLSCLHQLRQENRRLEEHVNSLVARRDHLLAINARLSVPLSGQLQQQQQQQQLPTGSNIVNGQMEAATSRNQRVNAPFLPSEGLVGGQQPQPDTNVFAHRNHVQSSSTRVLHGALASPEATGSTPDPFCPSQSSPVSTRTPVESPINRSIQAAEQVFSHSVNSATHLSTIQLNNSSSIMERHLRVQNQQLHPGVHNAMVLQTSSPSLQAPCGSQDFNSRPSAIQQNKPASATYTNPVFHPIMSSPLVSSLMAPVTSSQASSPLASSQVSVLTNLSCQPVSRNSLVSVQQDSMHKIDSGGASHATEKRIKS